MLLKSPALHLPNAPAFPHNENELQNNLVERVIKLPYIQDLIPLDNPELLGNDRRYAISKFSA